LRVRSPNIQYRQGLDHLRGFAATLIVFYHGLHLVSFFPRAQGGDAYRFWIKTWNPGLALIEEGHSAVTFFMVLSGFLFSVAAVGKEVIYGAFLKNRLLRIAPLLLFVLIVGLVANPSSYTFLGVLQTLLFQADFPGAAQVGMFSGMFWAVAVEFQLYLLFPFLHRFVEEHGLRWALGCIALCLAMRLMAAYVGSSNPRDIAYGHVLGRLDQFIIGMLTARLYRRIETLALPWGVLCGVSTLVVLAVLLGFNQLGGYPNMDAWKVVWPTFEALLWAQLIVTYTRFAERIPSWLGTPLAAYGSISYSIYLLHSTCIVLLARAWEPYFLHPDPNIAAIIFVPLCVLPVLIPLATLSYWVVERPFLALRVQYLR
jgi:peptidoglycan/LPS O-acetylase OafA/YrhL